MPSLIVLPVTPADKIRGKHQTVSATDGFEVKVTFPEGPLRIGQTLKGHSGRIDHLFKYMLSPQTIGIKIVWPGYEMSDMILIQLTPQTSLADVANKVSYAVYSWFRRQKELGKEGALPELDVRSLEPSLVYVTGLTANKNLQCWHPTLALYK